MVLSGLVSINLIYSFNYDLLLSTMLTGNVCISIWMIIIINLYKSWKILLDFLNELTNLLLTAILGGKPYYNSISKKI